MPTHEYTPQRALEILLQKLVDREPSLAEQVRGAVDQGEDVEETDSSRGRRRERHYRKTVPYEYREALDVALNTLRANFIEQPLVVNSFYENMTQAVVGEPRRSRFAFDNIHDFGIIPETKGAEKPVQIELRTETQLPTAAQAPEPETQQLTPVSPDRIHEQQENLRRLQELLDFS